MKGKTLGENIRKLRLDKKLTFEALGERCGLHYTYLAKIEKGVQDPTLASLGKIAAALDTTPGFLLKEQVTPKEFALEKLYNLLKHRGLKEIEFVIALAEMVFARIHHSPRLIPRISPAELKQLIQQYYKR